MGKSLNSDVNNLRDLFVLADPSADGHYDPIHSDAHKANKSFKE